MKAIFVCEQRYTIEDIFDKIEDIRHRAYVHSVKERYSDSTDMNNCFEREFKELKDKILASKVVVRK